MIAEAAAQTQYWLTRLCFQRSLAFIYLIGFLIAANQGTALIGARGLLPARLFVSQIGFWDSPSLFFLNCSDRAMLVGAWFGVALSALAILLARRSGAKESEALLAGALAGLAWATVRRAADDLGVIVTRVGEEGKRGGGEWRWMLADVPPGAEADL